MIDPTTNSDLATDSSTVATPLRTDSSPGLGASSGGRALTGNGHDRIHRLAGTMHRAIDSIEQRMSSAGGGMSLTQVPYGEQVRQYGDQLRTRMTEQPLQFAGILLAAGVLLDRLFLRKPKERAMKEPVRTHSTWEASPPIERRARRWSNAAEGRLQRVGRAGEEAAGQGGMAAALGIARARDKVSNLAREANALPLQMRLATQRLRARSQEYGSMARSTMEAHPWAGVGAVLAASGLLTTVLMRRRDPASGKTHVSGAERRNDIAPRMREYDTQTGLGGMISSRPLASGVVLLGLGMLAGAMLRRRMW